jgi:hypothetical protein
VAFAVPSVQANTAYSQTVYRSDAFATQQTKILCTAAVVQNIINLANGESRRDKLQQLQLYTLGRQNNRYTYKNAGVDPQGVEVMLETSLPGTDWRVITTKKLQKLLRRAARQMRATGLPVVMFVAGGRHVWTMNGYTATRDPALGGKFTVTRVRFSGPNYPKVKARYGWFDLAPNTSRSAHRLGNAYFKYSEKLAFGQPRPTIWRGWFVAVVPWTVGDPDPDPDPTPDPSASPDPSVEPSPESPPQP